MNWTWLSGWRSLFGGDHGTSPSPRPDRLISLTAPAARGKVVWTSFNIARGRDHKFTEANGSVRPGASACLTTRVYSRARIDMRPSWVERSASEVDRPFGLSRQHRSKPRRNSSISGERSPSARYSAAANAIRVYRDGARDSAYR